MEMTLCVKSGSNGLAKGTKAHAPLWCQFRYQEGRGGISGLSAQGLSLAHPALRML
jgi:hypothetical protein